MATQEPTRLHYDDKAKRLEEVNSFESICTEEAHEAVIQDDVFGKAKKSKDGNRWVYIAQEKDKKSKSLFLGGSGKAEHEHDFGETYDGISRVGIFIWDIKKKTVFQIKEDLASHEHIPACPVFADEEGTQVIFHAYKKTEFGHGLVHCYNRPINIFEAEVLGVGEEIKTKVKTLETKTRTSIFPTVSTSF